MLTKAKSWKIENIMKYLLIGDVHANSVALMAVLEDAAKYGPFKEILNAGDTVGYGPEPELCISLLKKIGAKSVSGNHDLVIAGKMSDSDFNPFAASAARIQKAMIDTGSIDYLSKLLPKIVVGPFTIVHGSPFDPVWEYVIEPMIANLNMPLFNTQYCLIGHSHIPDIWVKSGGVYGVSRCFLQNGSRVKITRKAIINAGSVGQPRDGNCKSSYMVWDSNGNTFTLHRVPYDIDAVQSNMISKNMPNLLVDRLLLGF